MSAEIATTAGADEKRERVHPVEAHAVHVGLHKTGSTWLQRFVFPRLSDPSFTEDRKIVAALTENLISAPDDAFLAESFRALIGQSERRGVRLLISSEAISGNLWGERTASRAARRLASVVPDARILLVVRNQSEMISALYAQYVNEGGYASFPDFLTGSFYGPTFEFESLEYDRLASLYVELFGRPNVLVVPYEHICAQRETAIDELCRFFGAERPQQIDYNRVNVSLSPLPMLAMRGWNRAFRVSAFNDRPSIRTLGQGARARRFLQERVDPLARRVLPPSPNRRRQALKDWGLARYAESNIRLSELSGFPLGELGYTVQAA